MLGSTSVGKFRVTRHNLTPADRRAPGRSVHRPAAHRNPHPEEHALRIPRLWFTARRSNEDATQSFGDSETAQLGEGLRRSVIGPASLNSSFSPFHSGAPVCRPTADYDCSSSTTVHAHPGGMAPVFADTSTTECTCHFPLARAMHTLAGSVTSRSPSLGNAETRYTMPGAGKMLLVETYFCMPTSCSSQPWTREKSIREGL